MADATYVTKIQESNGGNTLTVASGGKLVVESGGALILTLPTADPHVVGQLYSASGVLTVSAG